MSLAFHYFASKKDVDTFTPVQDEVYDIFTEVSAFVKWINATAVNMGGLQACKFLETTYS